MAELQHHINYVERKIDFWRAVEAHDEQAAASIAHEVNEIARATLTGRG